MGATPAQIAAAQALAKSRGYNPNLVDADNADRANTAFPVQSAPKPASAPAPKPAAAPAASAAPQNPGGGTGPMPADTTVPIRAPGVIGGIPDTPAAGGAVPPALAGLQAAGGGGGGSMASVQEPSNSPAPAAMNLRPNLGNRLYPQDSSVLAGLQRAY